MKDDHLEEFIRHNRQEFEDDTPSASVWENIATNLAKEDQSETPTVSLQARLFASNYWKVAAALLISLGSILTYEWFDDEEVIVIASESQLAQPEAEEIINPELAEAEAYYSGKINSQLHELKKYTAAYPGLEEEVAIDLEDLDAAFQELKNELDHNIANEEIIGAMIENYQIKTEILQDILEGLQSNHTTQKDDDTTIQL